MRSKCLITPITAGKDPVVAELWVDAEQGGEAPPAGELPQREQLLEVGRVPHVDEDILVVGVVGLGLGVGVGSDAVNHALAEVRVHDVGPISQTLRMAAELW